MECVSYEAKVAEHTKENESVEEIFERILERLDMAYLTVEQVNVNIKTKLNSSLGVGS